MPKIEIYKGEDMAAALSSLGCPSAFVGHKISPSVINYYFNFLDIGKFAKLQKAIKGLSVLLREDIKQPKTRKAHFCLQINRAEREFATFRQLHGNLAGKPKGSFLLGLNEDNECETYNIEKCPHLLVAGCTNSGKSVFLNSFITCLSCYENDCGLVLIDPKKVEFSQFENNPRLLCPIITDTTEAILMLNQLCDIMDERYEKLRQNGLRDNSTGFFPKIIIVVDELADLMLTSKKEAEEPLVRIAQKGRASGLHLVLATQRSTVNVVTGLLKANIPCRVAFSMSSIRDSMVLLDYAGANELLGKGDALVKLPDRLDTIRIQAPYISTEDIQEIFKDCKPRETAKIAPKIKKFSFFDKILGKRNKIENRADFVEKTAMFEEEREQNLFSVEELNDFDCFDDE